MVKEDENNEAPDGPIEQIQKTLESMSLKEFKGLSENDPETKDIMDKKVLEALGQGQPKDNQKNNHKFWSTQPVRQDNADKPEPKAKTDVQPFDTKTVKEVRQEPYNLPKGFEWSVVDIDIEASLTEVYDLLTENYVEDDDNMFRFDYSREFLKWALRPPGFIKDWVVGVRNSKNQKLLALITGIPAKVHVHNKVYEMAEINFLCINKVLRTKRLAPVLIKEVTRRVNLTGRWQAVYTAGVKIPGPVAKCRYYHRSINPVKLVEVKFSGLGPRMTLKRLVRLNKLPDTIDITGFRKMEEKDVPRVTKLLKKHLRKFNMWIEWDQVEVKHWLLERKGVVNTYVVANSEDVVTDFCSFYHIPSTVIGHDKYNNLNAAYSFYNVATSVPLKRLVENSLVMARDIGVDVFNCLDLLDNREFLDALKFGKGDGNLHYYLFNLKCPFMESDKVGIVLL